MLHTFGSSWLRGGRGLQVWDKSQVPTKELEARVAKMRSAMKKNGIDIMLLSENVAYLKSEPVLIVPKDGPLVVVTPRANAPSGEGGQAWLGRRNEWVREIIQLGENDADMFAKEVKVVIDGMGLLGGKIGYVGVNNLPAQFASLKRNFYESEFVDATPLMSEIMANKSEVEQNLIAKAAQLEDVACKTLAKNAKAGMTEMALMAEVDHVIKLGGAQDHKFSLSTGADAQKVLRPGLLVFDKKLAEGDVILYNACIQYMDYFSEIGRTLSVGKASKEQTALLDAAIKAQTAGIAAAKSGAKASDVAKAIQKVIKDAGYEKYLNKEYGLGHGIGVIFEDEPVIDEANNTALKAGMAIVVKVGLHAPKIGGAFLADTLIVTDKEAKKVTITPYKL